MEPKKETENGVVALLDRVLDKGVVVRADLIISLADIPLIGVNLSAAIANIQKMLDYGMFEDWDEAMRARKREKENENKEEANRKIEVENV